MKKISDNEMESFTNRREKILKKIKIFGKKLLIAHSLLEKIVETSTVQISLSSSTFQVRHFWFKFGTQACDKVVYKAVLQISPIF